MDKNYVIACSTEWDPQLPGRLENRLGQKFHYINNKDDFSLAKFDMINPRYIFLPHWSYIVPKEIFSKYECVVFHMTDLPFGRGGSPLQNLIARGIYETKVSALRCEQEIDSGPVYMKMPLSLHGNAEEIYLRAMEVIEEMLVSIVKSEPKPVEQKGEATNFKRRKAEDGDIGSISELRKIYDYIRMLDASGYPKAFLETDNLIIEFERATLKKDCIKADVIIKIKKDNG